MPGKPGMTGPNMGGKREGAGRPQTRIILKVGDKLLTNRQTPDGATMPELLTVIEVKHNFLRLQADSGDTVVMIR